MASEAGEPLCLYSTNPWIKWWMCRTLRGDVHHVWCSPIFDPKTAGKNDPRSAIAASSSPAEIYRRLARAVADRDRGDPKIISQRASLASLIEDWRRRGQVTTAQADDCLDILRSEDLSIWRPSLYVIPYRGDIAGRVERVPYASRAAIGEEFVLRDLAGDEFDRLDLDV